jgi:two-component system chemotaxis response regulator CheB
MIVDDSAIARAVLSRMLSIYPEFEVVALAANAEEALDVLKRLTLDIVVLDVEMPSITGLEALPEILQLGKGARVLIVSSHCEDGAQATIEALALGATDTLPKPGTGNFAGKFSEILAERLRRIGPPDRGVGNPGPTDQAAIKLRPMPDGRLGCLALGASTGGLHALDEFLHALPEKIGAPILVTQHLPSVFMASLARQLEAASGRTSVVVEEGMRLVADRIHIAPGDAHLALSRVGSGVSVKLDRSKVSSGCLPSVDPMFHSVGEIYAKAGLGVVLSGMGRDGLAGSVSLVERGGAIFVQNRETCAVWGMPRAVAEAGLASAMLAPAELAGHVGARTKASVWT